MAWGAGWGVGVLGVGGEGGAQGLFGFEVKAAFKGIFRHFFNPDLIIKVYLSHRPAYI